MNGCQYSQTVDELLLRLVDAIESNRFHILADRKDHSLNQQTLDELDYTIEDATDEFRSLKKHHCQSGPKPDDNGDRGMFWVFSKSISGRPVYMKVMESNYGNFYVGFSFHFPTKQQARET